ncbi:hypothetical protein [Rubrobacter aplysinae]|uniref:hypothetical protein n=1 Tax=Rubrobacter aplysinae TaxID=909625 RepID=UPI00064C2103|nr:hypothetical protein [Rubrobacter aplysinae]
MLVRGYNNPMTLKKMTTYMEDDLLRSVKALAATRGEKIYEILAVALKRYLEEEETAQAPASPVSPASNRPRELSLAEALSERSEQYAHRTPGVPREKAVHLPEGETLSEAVLAERESSGY